MLFVKNLKIKMQQNRSNIDISSNKNNKERIQQFLFNYKIGYTYNKKKQFKEKQQQLSENSQTILQKNETQQIN